uniref:T-box domain-containing protein n=1 Tax=Mola mola TaxID=94237 RepID=A0A3Q3WD13_MOLML
MQALSSRAHAFSVEALVGKPCKRMKVSDGHDLSLAADTGSETSIFTGETEGCLDFQDKPEESDGRADREVRVELQGSELWKRFYEIGTEMIITKAGRRMFPSVRVKVRNLDPCQQYYIAMDVMPVDSKRYRYVYHSSQWMVAGNTDHSCIAPRLYVHPDSPCAGETWMRQVISFDRVKLTNNEMDDKGHIILQSMHKYKPRVHIIKHDPRVDLFQIRSLPAEGVHSFSFPETEFTTVTAYQNQQITKLKIDRNPFAKGFRDPGRNRYEKPHQTLTLTLKPGKYTAKGPERDLSSMKAFSPLGANRLTGLSPLTDRSLLSALQAKKVPHCREPCLHTSAGSSPCLFPLHGPFSPHGHSLLPRLSDTVGPYCLYRYSIPLSPQLTAIPWHAKLEDTTDCLVRQPPWHSTTNHCL